MRARGRVSVCNEMKVAIDKVAGANEQSEGEVRGWLMETRPRMGEKNCTRAAGKSGGGQAGLWAAEMKRLQAVQSARELGRARQTGEYSSTVCAGQASEPTDAHTHARGGHLVPPPPSAGRVCRAGALRVWCDHAVPKNRHAPRPLYALTPYTNWLTTRRNCALTGHCCRDAVVAPRLITSHRPSACSRRRIALCTPASGIFAVVGMQSIITQIRLHRGAWGNTRRGADLALRNQSDSLRVTQSNPSR